MPEITSPLRRPMTGDSVADLHNALVQLGFHVKDGERNERRFGTSTRDAVRKFQEAQGLEASGEVDEKTAAKLNELLRPQADEPSIYRVTGSVLRADGSPVAQANVRLFRQGIARVVPLGNPSAVKTDAKGGFAFSYPRPADGFIDLRIELEADRRRDIAETRPQLISGATADERVTFVVGDEALRGRSTFEQLENNLTSALAGEGLEPRAILDFDQATLARLSIATGELPATLVVLRQAYALARETGLDAAVLFGMGHAGKLNIASLSHLLLQGSEERRAAVEAGLRANEMPARLRDQAGKILDQLDARALSAALEDPAAPNVTSTGTLLEAAGLDLGKRKKLAELYLGHEGTAPEFWTKVRSTNLLSEDEIGRVQFELQLGLVTQNHAPLNRALKTRGVARLRDLAELRHADWLGLVQGTALPADLEALGTTAEQYVDLIERTVEEAIPSALVVARAEQFPDTRRIKTFLERNTAFDVRRTPLRRYLQQNPSALEFAGNEAEAHAVTRAVERLERVFRVAPAGKRVATATTLLRHGFGSARAIRTTGRAAFLARVENDLGGREAAEEVFRRANNTAATAATLAMRFSPATNTSLAAFPFRRVPNVFADVFGGLDFCSCEHCQSVYSPAAYFVDTLRWLGGFDSEVPIDPNTPEGDKVSVLDLLLFDGRRPDLAGIELSCANTHTPLPYIDLVNEVLELLVAPTTAAPVRYQTSGSAADLRAHPEHLREEAYEILAGREGTAKDAVYPFHLPYNLWLDEARIYLGQLGVPRYQLMEQLLSEAALGNRGVAIETLGMSPLEWDIIAGEAEPARSVAEYWGLKSDPAFLTKLENVSFFLGQAAPPHAESGLSYSDLTELLRADFIQKPQQLKIVFTGTTCNTEEAKFKELSEAHLDRIHRFLRLQRRLGWSVADLDRAIQVLGGGVLNSATLQKIAHLCRVAADTKRPIAELLVLWGPLDARRWRLRLVERPLQGGFELVFDDALDPQPLKAEDASPYDRAFQSAALGATPSDAFGIGPTGLELQTPAPGGLPGQLTVIASALSATVEELGELLPGLGPAPAALNLANLSALARHVSLARILSLSVRELLSVIALTGIEPFAADTTNLLRFLREVQFIRASAFSLDELSYLLRATDTKPAALELENTEIGTLLWELGVALRKARLDSQLAPPEDPPTTSEAREMAAVVERLASALGLEVAVASILLQKPVGGGGSLLGVFTAPALFDYKRTKPGSNEPVLPTPLDLPDQFVAFKRLRRAALVVSRLRLDKEELEWVLDQGPGRGLLDVLSLPVEPNPPTAQYAAWRRLAAATQLRDRFSPRRLFDLFKVVTTGATLTQVVEELSRRSGWNLGDVDFLLRAPAASVTGPLGFSFPDDFQDDRPFVRLAEVLTGVRRIGLSAETVWGWRHIALPGSASPADVAGALEEHKRQASEIRRAVRARYDEPRWHEIAPPLRDRLREHQRDALAGWLIGNARAEDGSLRFADTNALFDCLLLDVQMSPCQLTSRIRQAIGSVQLYVQRILLGLEHANLSKDAAKEWRYNRLYRVWEANRKVFLYPENWLEPELRDDKTPFFVELENELLQSEITSDSAETALRHYLQKLDDVARPEIIGISEFKDEEGVPTLHVFGKTRNTPPTYYHRSRTGNGPWTPWEKVEAGIEGSHVLPYVFNRRLYLFWLMITEAALEEENVSNPLDTGAPAAPRKYYQIRLAFSEYKDGTWTPKKIAEPVVDAKNDAEFKPLEAPTGANPSDFFLVAIEVAGDLVVDVFRQVGGIGYVLKPANGIRPTNANSPEHGDWDGGVFDPGSEAPVNFQYQCVGRFRMSSCTGAFMLSKPAHSIGLSPPVGLHSFGQRFRGEFQADLLLPAQDPITHEYRQLALLQTPWTPLEVVPPRMDALISSRPFFLQDTRRTFLVSSEDRFRWVVDTSSQAADWTELDTATMLAELPGRPTPTGSSGVSTSSGFEANLLSRAVRPSGLLRLLDPANSLASSYGSRATTIAGRPPARPGPSRHVSAAVVVVDTAGVELTRMRTGRAVDEGQSSSSIEFTHTLTMPALAAPAPVVGATIKKKWLGKLFKLKPFYHPYVCLLRRELNRFGLDGIYDHPSLPDGSKHDLVLQQEDDDFFPSQYKPKTTISIPYPMDAFDFDFGGAYSTYNWEVFFHIPLSIACQLSRNQRFEEARTWFHRIFDPTETVGDVPARFWKVKPLFELFNDETDDTGPIAELLLLLSYDGTDPEKLQKRDELVEQVATMRRDPFNPHALARVRLAVYARSVVMKYLDNLIAWGDHLFRQDTMESTNEATQLYILAAQLLGRRPCQVDREPHEAKTFAELQSEVDPFGNILLEKIEGFLPEPTDSESDTIDNDVELLSGTFYFCIPPNDKLLTDYWDRVADRLFKLRHCMNIEGVVRQLPLFEPPIDPALLVRARAAGLDLASVLSDLNAPAPHYRYQVLLQKALELASDVRGHGQALLSALEKKDAEELSLLRAGHQLKLEEAMLEVRRKQVDEAKEAKVALDRSRENAESRRDYYRSREFTNRAELLQVFLSGTAAALDVVAAAAGASDAVISATPDVTWGFAGYGGSPVWTGTMGGSPAHRVNESLIANLRILAGLADRGAQLSGLAASFERRADDWQHQARQADKDVEMLERQILAAEIRVAIAEKELENLTLQLEQSKEAEALLRDKYTNLQLYQWMVGQISALHFQAYQLAYDLARRAQAAWKLEFPDKAEPTFIQFGYWDSLKKGLLAGDRLCHDLKRMDAAYLDANVREHELVRHVPLRELNPGALLELKRTGTCQFEVPEAWFDLVTPGHYLRRIKTVSLSLPSVTGPYVSVPCKLSLGKTEIRKSAGAPDLSPGPAVATRAIVTSHAQEDSGLFETNLRDERYLPFEGAGAISNWTLELPDEFRPFDYSTISDAVLHIRYTARSDDSEAAQLAAKTRVKKWLADGKGVLFASARVDFPDAWARFLAPADDQTDQVLGLALDKRLLPHFIQEQAAKIKEIEVFLVGESSGADVGAPIQLAVAAPGGSGSTLELAPSAAAPQVVLQGKLEFAGGPKPLGSWTVRFAESLNTQDSALVVTTANGHRRLNASAVRDLLVVVQYQVGG